MLNNFKLFFKRNKILKFRKRSEMYIINNNKLTVGYSEITNFYSIPGGTIEDNEDPLSAAKRETLEEIGVNVINVKPLNKNPHITNYSEMYGNWNNYPDSLKKKNALSLKTYSFVGYFDKRNRSLYGDDGDQRRYRTISYETMMNYLKKKLVNPNLELHWKDRSQHCVNMLILIKNKGFL